MMDSGEHNPNLTQKIREQDCLNLKTIGRELLRRKEYVHESTFPDTSVLLPKAGLKKKDGRTTITRADIAKYIETGLKQYQTLASELITYICQVIQVN